MIMEPTIRQILLFVLMGNVSPFWLWLLDLGLRGRPEEAWRCTGDIRESPRESNPSGCTRGPLPSSQCLCSNLVKSSNYQTRPAGQVQNSPRWKRFETQCSTLRIYLFMYLFFYFLLLSLPNMSYYWKVSTNIFEVNSSCFFFGLLSLFWPCFMNACFFSPLGLCVISRLRPMSVLYHSRGIFCGSPFLHPTSLHTGLLDSV